MSSHVICSHCNTPLRVPEDCGGRATRCPSCLAEFVLPGARATADTSLVAAVPAPAAGTVTQADLAAARLAFEQLKIENVGLQVQLAKQKRRRQLLAVRLRALTLFLSTRKLLDRSFSRLGGFFVAVAVGGALFVLLASLFSPSAFGYFASACLGMIVAGLAYLPFSFVPDDASLELRIPPVHAKLAEASLQFDRTAIDEAREREKMLAAEAEYQRLKAAIESRLHFLRNCQWEVMTGANFEAFLAEVFQERGFAVEITGRTGDQGVDLVAVRQGRRIAVQAKGYVGRNVGNEAVQQAHAGMTFHRCQSALVITNSRFTSSARELAEKIGCTLIDGSQMSDLIDGRIL